MSPGSASGGPTQRMLTPGRQVPGGPPARPTNAGPARLWELTEQDRRSRQGGQPAVWALGSPAAPVLPWTERSAGGATRLKGGRPGGLEGWFMPPREAATSVFARRSELASVASSDPGE